MSNKFNYIKKGYDPAEVDAYIDTMEAVIKSYKEKDSAIKNAILSAQIAADSMIKNAKNEASEIRGSALIQIEDIKNSISTQKEMLKSFQDEYTSMINKYLHSVNNNEIGSIKNKITSMEAYLDKFTNKKEPTASEPNLRLEPKQETSKISEEEQNALLK